MTVAYSYAELTKAAAAGIAAHMHAARRCKGAESASKQEIAYGIYIGWRALVEACADQAACLADDQRLAAMLVAWSSCFPPSAYGQLHVAVRKVCIHFTKSTPFAHPRNDVMLPVKFYCRS